MDGSAVLLIGTGAMASLFAALLSANGIKVKLLGSWKENINALNEKGVQFIDQHGKKSIYGVEAFDDPEQCMGSQLAIVLVKSYQTSKAAILLGRCLRADGLALTLQNGLGNYEILASTLGRERVVSGVTTVGATSMGPGIVCMGGAGVISIGAHERIKIPVRILRQAGLEVDVVKDTDSLVWGKLVINASINPLTATLGVKNGVLLENPNSVEIMSRVAKESANVAVQNGVELPYEDPMLMVQSVAEKTAANYSSMFIDVQRGGLTEIDAINGAIVKVGEEIGAAIEYNRLLWKLVKAMTGN